jgi:ATP adenylyltransferase
MTFYCFQNYRFDDQLAEMQRLEAEGTCLFCPDGLRQHAADRILHESGSWFVILNKFPYRGTKLHLLIIPREHVGDMADLHPAAQSDFWSVLSLTRERFELSHYGLGIRNGDCRFTGATIAHLHAHVLVGDPDSDTDVRMRLSSHPHAPGDA